mmetsp:Transcript_929/g.2932  ORF Transcript_929/g.2932 Transcript_929/m.2932 type:complete len:123 (-) Transcript_929:104-472(-)
MGRVRRPQGEVQRRELIFDLSLLSIFHFSRYLNHTLSPNRLHVRTGAQQRGIKCLSGDVVLSDVCRRGQGRKDGGHCDPYRADVLVLDLEEAFFLIALLGESNTMSMPSSYHAKTHQPLKIF